MPKPKPTAAKREPPADDPPVGEAASRVVSHHVAVRSAADEARESFPGYLRLAGRTEHGQRLRLDPGVIDRAAAMEHAYRQGNWYWSTETRGGLKTTTVVAFIAWMCGRDPNLSVGYWTNREPEANQRNRWIQAIASTDEHQRVFGKPGTLLRPKCNAANTTFFGKTASDIPNIHVEGIEGARAGPHYDVAVLDDVCDQKSSFVQAARKSGIIDVFFGTILPELNPAEQGRMGVGMLMGQGTAYAPDDLNAKLAEVASQSAADGGDGKWIYRFVPCGGPPDFASPFPTVLPPSFLRQQYDANPRFYEMNYMLVPLGADERPFREIRFWLSTAWVENARRMNLWNEQCSAIGYEPGVLPAEDPTHPWERVMAVDPAFKTGRGTSATGIIIGTQAPTEDIFTLYAAKRRQSWDKTVDEIPRLFQQYRCTRLVIEVAGQQEAGLVSLERDFRAKGLPHVEAVLTHSRSKLQRAMDIAPRVNAGRVFLAGHIAGRRPNWRIEATAGMRDLHDDLLAFPGTGTKDLTDAFVYCVRRLRERQAPGGPKSLPPDDAMRERWQRFAEKAFGREPTRGEIEEARVFE